MIMIQSLKRKQYINLDLLDYLRKYGYSYNTEDSSIFFYALTKMKRYRNFLELGTGWGCTAFLVAAAMKENGIGKCITYDNGQDYENVRYSSFINQMINEFGLSEHIDFRNQNIVLDNITGQSFDCIFSDFDRSVAFIDKFIGWSLFNVNDHSL